MSGCVIKVIHKLRAFSLRLLSGTSADGTDKGEHQLLGYCIPNFKGLGPESPHPQPEG